MATLRELKAEYLQVLNDEELEFDSWAGMLGVIEDEIEVKFDNYLIMIEEFEAIKNKFEKEAKRTADIADSFARKIKWLKDNMYQTMIELDKKEVENEFHTIKIQANGGVAPLVFDETKEVPEEFIRVKTEVDNTKIREALKAGELDFVRLGERGTHLVIK